MHWIYILECDKGVTYVGETSRITQRIQEHITYKGSKITKKYKPEKILAIYNAENFDIFIKFYKELCYKERGIRRNLLRDFNYNHKYYCKYSKRVFTQLYKKIKEECNDIGNYGLGVKDYIDIENKITNFLMHDKKYENKAECKK